MIRQDEDRRSSDRFPIERDVHYKTLNGRKSPETGCGKTLNISSTGILFTTENTVDPGKRLEISVSWPAHLDSTCRLKLVAKGRVVRSLDGKAAMEIEKYEFRTQGSKGLAPLV